MSMEQDDAFFDEMELHVDTVPHAGAWNMAVDQALLERGGLPVLRVYGWDTPTVTMGYAQSVAKLADALPDWPVVRRWTGGGVVFHGEDFTYTVMVPAGLGPWVVAGIERTSCGVKAQLDPLLPRGMHWTLKDGWQEVDSQLVMGAGGCEAPPVAP